MSLDEEKHDDLTETEKKRRADDATSTEPKRKKKRRRTEDDLAETTEPVAEEEEEAHGDEDEGGDSVDDESSDEEDPYWWTPHATLFALIVLGILGFFGAFRQKTAEERATRDGAPTTTAAAQPTTAINPRPLNLPQPQPGVQQAGAQPAGEQIEAQHLVVMHKDSMRVPAGVTRTKEEAKKRAEEALAKLKKGTAFDQLVKDYSDEGGAGARTPAGTLGTFGKGRMDPAFEAGAFALKPGETSGVVESKFGFHIIKRNKLRADARGGVMVPLDAAC